MQMRGPIIIALLLALGSTFFAARFLKSKPAGQPEKMAQVVVAVNSIPERTQITPEMVKVQAVPASYIHRDAIRSLNTAVGRITQAQIVAGEQVLSTRLVQKGKEPSLSFAIPPGMRAISVAVNEVIGVAGFIKPQDRVDVLATFPGEKAGEETTTTVLESVEVLAIAQDRQENQQKEAKVVTTVTLAVDASGAARLTLAEEMGKLRLALRPAVGSGAKIEAKATARELVGQKPVIAAPSPRPQRTSRPRPAQPPVKKPKLIEVIEGGRRSFVTVN